MARNEPFPEEPSTTREAIMKATYRALCEHGYADLTIQRIGDRFEKSKSLLYHHYDSKDDLLLDFLEYMLEEFEESVPEAREGDAGERLRAILDGVVAEELDEERREFRRAMVELRAQAATDERYRDHFTRHDRFFRERLAEVIREGIEEGVFREVDPDDVAGYLITAIGGEMTARATTEEGTTKAVRRQLDAYVDRVLLAERPDE